MNEEPGAASELPETSEVASKGQKPWYAAFSKPIVWGPTAGVAALVVGALVFVAVSGGGDAEAAGVASSTPSPTEISESADAQSGSHGTSPSATAEPSATASPEPSSSATAGAEASAGPEGGQDIGAPADGDALASTATLCVPDASSTAVSTSADGVMMGDPDATSKAVAPKSLKWGGFFDPHLSADGTFLTVVGSEEGVETAMVVKTATGARIASHGGFGNAVAEWNPALTRVALGWTADETMHVTVVQPSTGAERELVAWGGRLVDSLAWSSDGACLLITHRSVYDAYDLDPAVHAFGVIDVASGDYVELGVGSDAVYGAEGIVFTTAEGSRTHMATMGSNGYGERTRGIGDGGSRNQASGGSDYLIDLDRDLMIYGQNSSTSSATLRNAHPSGDGDGTLATITGNVQDTALARDGSRVAFTAADYEQSTDRLGMVRSIGGPVVWADLSLANDQRLLGLSWAPDGSGVVTMVITSGTNSTASTVQPILVALDGSVTPLASAVAGSSSCDPTWSADGDTLVWCAGGDYPAETAKARLYVVTR
ncbi:hypothetical protein [Demequina zhanjiangensis]|uniref:WD40-like Beta Propeller Repeat n=1 Tax=Demequina zhanjiangensis TaxID=3051659 RepID=A0ABT8FYB9_9MICO|nr:hypothetical protein [Demequina sp. SYSU T00b26]MDN4471891.1 hypothetical protein [Demequina sp. SYSU T00b26]